MPSEMFGMPFYLAVAVICFAIVMIIGIIRGIGRGGGGGADRAKSGSNLLQTIAALAGILSFVVQVLQWLNIIG